MKSLSITRALVVALALCSGVTAFGQQKKITVQGVVRRAGASGTDALINSSGQAISLTLKCEPAGSCGGAEKTYTTSSGLDSGDATITVRNGAFSVSLSPSASTLADMATYKAANWWVLIDGQLDPFSPSTEFAIRLESVPFAYVAELATTALNSQKLQGVTVDIPLGAGTPDGKILKFSGGKLTVQDDNNSGGGGGGGTYTAGTGINIDGSNVVSVSSAVPLMSGGKISASNLNLGTSANQIPQLDGSGKLNSSVMPSDVATLSAGKIPSSMIDATSIPNNTINSNHIADGSIGAADLALGGVSVQHMAANSVGTTQLQDSSVTDAKIVGMAASKLTGTLTAAQMPANMALNAVTATTLESDQITVHNQGELRLSEGVGGGSNYIGLKAPATLAGNLAWTLPDVDGANNQVMKFNATTKTFYWDNDAGASGGVSGPGASTANALVRWNGTAGTTLLDSSVTLDGSGNFGGVNSLTATQVNVSGLTASQVVVSDGSKNLASLARGDILGSGSLSVASGTNAALGGNVTLSISTAGASANGILTSTDWATFNGKLGSSVVSQSELDALDGVTGNLAKANMFTLAEAGRLAGVTSNIQSQIDAAFSAITSAPSATNRIARAGDTMSGTLGLAGANTTPDRVAYLNANRELVTSANVSSAELEFLDGVTSSIQSQIDAAFAAISSSPSATGRIARTGDTMSGALGFEYAGVTPSRVAYIDSNRQLKTSNTVTNAELDFLAGVTSSLSARVNLFTNAEAGRLAGVTSGIQSQIDSAFSAISSIPSATNRVAKAGDTMTGGLGLQYAGVTPSRVAYVDANRQLMTSNTVTNTELDFLGGVTSGIQSQIDAAFSAIASAPSATGRIARTGDTMSGTLGLAGANTTPDRVAYLNANRELVTSTVVSSAELDFLDGVTSNLGAKVNLFTATEAGRLAGVTSGIQSQIDAAFSAMSGLASSSSLTTGLNAKLNKAGDTMTGDLNLANQKELRFSEASGSGTNYIGIKAPATLAADLGWTLPDVDGGNNQLMKFNATTKTFYWDNDAGAAGGVTGPGSSAANGIARWNGTAGTTLKSSGIVITDADTMNGIVGLTAANINVTGLAGGKVLVSDGAKNISESASVDTTELGFLDGVTSGLQAQIDSAFSAISSIPSATNRVAKAGDTMTGGLGLQYAGVTPSRVAYVDANRQLMTSNTVTNTELDFLAGVTSNLGAKVNLFTNAEAGRLAGVTSGIQSQIDSAFSAISLIPSATNRVAKAGDTMTGKLGLDYANATPDRAAFLNANRELVTSNNVSSAELEFLDGVTSGLQAQIDAAFSAISSAPSATGRIARTGDTMSGTLGLAGANTTPDRVAYLNANRELVTSTVVSSAELDFLDGVTSNLGAKVNLFTALEAGRLAGVTSGIQSQIDSAFSAISSLPSAGTVSGKVAKAGDTMTGKLGLDYANATPDRAAFLNANRELVTSNNVSSAELEFLDGVTSGIQSQIDAAFAAISSSPSATGRIARTGDTMSGALGFEYAGVTPSRVAYIDSNRQLKTSNTVTNAELDFLGGVTSNLGAKVNLFTALEAGRLAGVTSGIQSQIDSAFSAISSIPSATNRVAKVGDTMTGGLGLQYAGVTPSRVAYVDANRQLMTSNTVTNTELDFLAGVTSNLGAKVNLFTATEAGYLAGVTTNIGSKINLVSAAEMGRLAGVTSGIQSQIDAAFSAISSAPSATGRIARTGDTMSGGLGFQYTGVTPSRVAYIDANRQLMTSNTVTNTELDYLSGATANIQSQLNAKVGLTADSVTAAMLKNDVAFSEAVTFDVLRTTDGNGETHANNTNRLVADRVYGNSGGAEGTDKITLPAVVRIPLSVAHTDCGVVDDAGGDMVVCAGF